MGEAKQIWPVLSPRSADRAAAELNAALDWAELDARAAAAEAPRQVAMVLASPRIAEHQMDHLPDLLQRWLAACASVPSAAGAAYFPFHGKPPIHNDDCYPGIALYLRILPP